MYMLRKNYVYLYINICIVDLCTIIDIYLSIYQLSVYTIMYNNFLFLSSFIKM